MPHVYSISKRTSKYFPISVNVCDKKSLPSHLFCAVYSWNILECCLFEYQKYISLFCQLTLCPGRPSQAFTVDGFLNYLWFSDCFRSSQVSSSLQLHSHHVCPSAVDGSPRRLRGHRGNICLWLRAYLFFLADLLTAGAGHAGWYAGTGEEKTRGRQSDAS